VENKNTLANFLKKIEPALLNYIVKITLSLIHNLKGDSVTEYALVVANIPESDRELFDGDCLFFFYITFTFDK